jgi:hypothetical protein
MAQSAAAANNPPAQPNIPDGQITGYSGILYRYSTKAIDPDGNQVKYTFDWGDGTTSVTSLVTSGTTAGASHVWTVAPGTKKTFNVIVKATDEFGAVSVWSSPSPVIIIAQKENHAPSLPSIPSGPTAGVSGTSYSFSTSSTDPDGDLVKYIFDFGDGSAETGFFPSGQVVTVSHVWNVPAGSTRTYNVRALSADSKYMTCSSPYWSDPLVVSITGAGVATDTVKPTVSLTAPTATTFTSAQTVAISANASDNVGVTRVEFYDGTTLLEPADTTAPYSYNWVITSANNGAHSLTAKAYDAAGNVVTSAPVSVTVNIGTSDTVKPTVSLTAPAATTFTSAQTVAINATASDNVGVTRVEFYDGTTLLEPADTTSPYSYNWAITAANNGTHSLTAKAYDAAGNSAVSTAVLVTVNINNADTIKPTVSISSPTSGTVSGITTVFAVATDNVGVERVEFYIDGARKITDYTSLYSYSWDTTTATNAAHTIYAMAYDAIGNVATSATVTVTVNNVVAGVGTPTIAITSPINNAIVQGTVSIGGTANDDKGVTKVEIYIDGSIKTTIVKPVYTLWKVYYAWNTASSSKGPHILTAKAYDADGKIGTSAPISVTVR